MNAALIVMIIDGLIALLSVATTYRINVDRLIETQRQADSEGRELTEAERQSFIDEAQQAIDEL